MTTMDSDSESQDSDEGRRFRFEATRKDDTSRISSRTKRSPGPRKAPSASRPRSKDRGSRDRRDHDKSRHERDKRDSRNNHNGKRNSKDRDPIDRHNKSMKDSKDSRYSIKTHSKDTKETHDPKPTSGTDKNSAEPKNSNPRESKDSKHSSNHKESKDSRSKALKTSDKDSKNSATRESKDSKAPEMKSARERDRNRKRSRDKSREKPVTEKHKARPHERNKPHSQEKSRDRSNHKTTSNATDQIKPKYERRPEGVSRRDVTREAVRRRINQKRDIHSPTKILDQIGSDTESDLGALDSDLGPVMTLETSEGCGDLDLADFDIVSDTEGSSSEDSSAAKRVPKGPIIKGEILPPHYYGPKLKRRVSRQKWERLLRRQAAVNRRRLEELRKVNPRNGDQSLGPSNSNPSAVSDFLLGPEASASASASATVEHQTSRETERRKRRKDVQSDMSRPDEASLRINCDNGRPVGGAVSARHKPSLVSVDNEDSSLEEESAAGAANDLQQKSCTYIGDRIASDLYGPVLPPKHPKNSNSNTRSPSEKCHATRRAAPSSHRSEHGRSRRKVSPNTDEGTSAAIQSGVSGSSQNGERSDSDNKESEISIGPCLPPHLKRKSDVSDVESQNSGSCKSSLKSDKGPITSTGPKATKPRIIGPSLPPLLQVQSIKSAEPDTQTLCGGGMDIGPALPPHLLQKKSVEDDSPDCVEGPVLPMQMAASTFVETVQGSVAKSDSEEDDMLGPMPADHPAAMDSLVQLRLEARARRIRDELRNGSEQQDKKREEWMVELPPAKAANIGLGPRKFRVRAAPDMSDRTSWTDTPADKARKQREKAEGKPIDVKKESERLATEQRDNEMREKAEKHKSKKHQESLLQMHQKKLEKKKKKEEKRSEETDKPMRRPFDRDVDLLANRFDNAQKKSILMKAQLLDDRFQKGKS